MSEVVDTDSQALYHLLTEAGVDWDGLSGEVARQADALLACGFCRVDWTGCVVNGNGYAWRTTASDCTS